MLCKYFIYEPKWNFINTYLPTYCINFRRLVLKIFKKLVLLTFINDDGEIPSKRTFIPVEN